MCCSMITPSTIQIPTGQVPSGCRDAEVVVCGQVDAAHTHALLPGALVVEVGEDGEGVSHVPHQYPRVVVFVAELRLTARVLSSQRGVRPVRVVVVVV